MAGFRAFAGFCAGLAASVAALHAEAALPPGVDPATGFRMQNIRAPTPDFVPGGTVVDHASVEAAIAGKTHVLIDVYANGAAPDPIGGEWAVSEPHSTIPTAIWLPGVGAGKLSPETESYYRRNLEAVTRGDKGNGVLLFCLADCWHSWNAAKRAADWGYAKVAWYPLGTDGWKEQGGALVAVTPVNFEGAAE